MFRNLKISRFAKLMQRFNPKVSTSLCANSINKFPFTVGHIENNEIPHVIEFIRKEFLGQEPLMKAMNLSESDKTKLEEIFHSQLQNGMSLIAKSPENSNEIAGVVLNSQSCSWDAEKLKIMAMETDSDTRKSFLTILSIINGDSDLHRKFKEKSIFEVFFADLLSGKFAGNFQTRV